MPVGIANQLDRIQSTFLWGGDEVKRKVHLVKWEEVCKNKCQGGLGVRKLSEFNECLLIKWWWIFGVEDKALWKKVLCSKYGQLGGWWSPLPMELGRVSVLWKDILFLVARNPFLRAFFFSNFKIVIGNGNVHKDSTMFDFVQRKNEGDDWNLMFRRQLFAWKEEDLSNLYEYLRVVPTLKSNVEDQCTWLANPSGAFFVASVWDWMALRKRCNLRFAMNIWKNIAPPKTEVETQNHVLLHYSSIWKVWSRIIDWWGLCWAIPKSVQSLLSWWVGFKVKKKVKMLWRIVPMAVLWSIWELRNACLFNNAQPHFGRVGGDLLFSVMGLLLVCWLQTEVAAGGWVSGYGYYCLVATAVIPIVL
ncbi:uncharacterized protein LOC114308353 [Camellia sinensis]|uniref:uncharacterized protein LOC114308353 n=1 Tax=Camellia sinensis TaxID=4442 RepID=UPI0010366452|nr:uncharacterized protein LOC114308353 [Camellia sinensis]